MKSYANRLFHHASVTIRGGAFHLYGETGENFPSKGTERFFLKQSGTGRGVPLYRVDSFSVKAWVLQFAATNLAGKNRVFHHGAWC